jgi:nitrogen fixation protein NifX
MQRRQAMSATTAFARRLTLIDPAVREEFMATALQVAFATSDQQHIDQHFGSAVGFAIYYVTPDETRFKEAIGFSAARQDGNEDKLKGRIEALAGCAAVFCQAVGGSAIAQLKRAGVQPIKVAPGLPINRQLAALRKELREGPAYWIVQALRGDADAGRFDDMDGEGWSE